MNGIIYYSTPDSIVSYNPDTKKSDVFYNLTDKQKESGSIYGLNIDVRGNVKIYVAESREVKGTIYDAGRITPENEPIEPTTVQETTGQQETETTTEKKEEEYKKYDFGTQTFKTMNDEELVVKPSDRPKLIFFSSIGCMNSSNMISMLEGTDLSEIDFIFADTNSASLKEQVEKAISQNYSYANQTKFCYDANRLAWSSAPANIGYSYTTPLALYLDKDNTVVYHTTGYDSSIISNVDKYLGVKLNKRVYGDIAKKKITLSSDKFVYTGKEFYPEVTVKETNGQVVPSDYYKVTYEDNVNAGTATVNITGTNGVVGTATVQFEIVKADRLLEISDDEYTLNEGDTCQVVVKSDADVKFESEDKEIASVDDKGIISAIKKGDTGIKVYIEDDDNHNGCEKYISVHVKKDNNSSATVSVSNCTIDDINETPVYDGTAKMPAVSVKYADSSLKENIDYTLDYKNNIDAGTAYVTITGRGKYGGVVTKAFNIDKAEQNITATAHTDTLDIGDSIRIATSSEGECTFTSSDENVAVVNKKGNINAVGKGSVTINVVAAETANYRSSKTSVKLNVTDIQSEKTDLSNATILFSNKNVYTGKEIKPHVTVMTKTTLEKDTDYVVTYENNVNAGTGYIVVNGIGDYTGAAIQKFTITKAKQNVGASLENKGFMKTGQFSRIITEGYGRITYELSDDKVGYISQGYFNSCEEG